jgi:hypothetical protein
MRGNGGVVGDGWYYSWESSTLIPPFCITFSLVLDKKHSISLTLYSTSIWREIFTWPHFPVLESKAMGRRVRHIIWKANFLQNSLQDLFTFFVAKTSDKYVSFYLGHVTFATKDVLRLFAWILLRLVISTVTGYLFYEIGWWRVLLTGEGSIMRKECKKLMWRQKQSSRQLVLQRLQGISYRSGREVVHKSKITHDASHISHSHVFNL